MGNWRAERGFDTKSFGGWLALHRDTCWTPLLSAVATEKMRGSKSIILSHSLLKVPGPSFLSQTYLTLVTSVDHHLTQVIAKLQNQFSQGRLLSCHFPAQSHLWPLHVNFFSGVRCILDPTQLSSHPTTRFLVPSTFAKLPQVILFCRVLPSINHPQSPVTPPKSASNIAFSKVPFLSPHNRYKFSFLSALAFLCGV